MWDEKQLKWWNKLRLIAVAMLVAAPLIYLAMSHFVVVRGQQGGQIEMMLYILLIVATIAPAAVKFTDSLQISNYRNSSQTKMTQEDLFLALSTIKFALVLTSYLLGLLVYFLSGNQTYMLYFYPIGIAWSFVYWPRKSQYEAFVDRMENKYGL
jgi:hypothetical protein